MRRLTPPLFGCHLVANLQQLIFWFEGKSSHMLVFLAFARLRSVSWYSTITSSRIYTTCSQNPCSRQRWAVCVTSVAIDTLRGGFCAFQWRDCTPSKEPWSTCNTYKTSLWCLFHANCGSATPQLRVPRKTLSGQSAETRWKSSSVILRIYCFKNIFAFYIKSVFFRSLFCPVLRGGCGSCIYIEVGKWDSAKKMMRVLRLSTMSCAS